MKSTIGLFILLFALVAQAEETLVVCGAGDVQACNLGRRVLQGLLVAQANNKFPADIDIHSMETVLKSQTIRIDSEQYQAMDIEQRADLLYKNFMTRSGQKLPTLQVRPETEGPLKNGGAAMSTGTRGGGFDLKETSLPMSIWY